MSNDICFRSLTLFCLLKSDVESLLDSSVLFFIPRTFVVAVIILMVSICMLNVSFVHALFNFI